MEFCGLCLFGRNQVDLLYFSHGLEYTGDSKSELLITVFYKIRIAHLIMNKGTININSIF